VNQRDAWNERENTGALTQIKSNGAKQIVKRADIACEGDRITEKWREAESSSHAHPHGHA
jgi:hypothetical protein